MILLVTLLAFALSFLFAMGGVGSAIVLVPVLHWLGVPLNEAKPTGLFVNTVGLSGATFSNIKERRLDFRLSLPIILSSAIAAPVGAYLSAFVPQRIVLGVFTAFLVFCGNVMLFFRSSNYSEQFRRDRSLIPALAIGVLAGLVAGLLGVGGGQLIAPLMVLMGFNPKKIAAITAFVVPFSSLTGFAAYWAMGHFDPLLALPVGAAAYLGGYLGTRFMQARLSPSMVRGLLGVLVLALAGKMLMNLLQGIP